MTTIPQSRLPVPVEVTNFVFLASPSSPTHVVLELHTTGNLVRVFLSKSQLQRLATKATAASRKVRD